MGIEMENLQELPPHFTEAMRFRDLGTSLVAYSAACSTCAKAFQWQIALTLHLGPVSLQRVEV